MVTPKGARPKPVIETVAQIVEHFQWRGPIGCGFPAAIVGNKVRTAKVLGIGERTEIEWFVGPHTINGKGTFDFLHKHLDWPKR